MLARQSEILRLACFCRAPIPRRSESVGVWMTIMRRLCFVGIVSFGMCMCLTTEYVEYLVPSCREKLDQQAHCLSFSARFVVGVALEHAVFGCFLLVPSFVDGGKGARNLTFRVRSLQFELHSKRVQDLAAHEALHAPAAATTSERFAAQVPPPPSGPPRPLPTLCPPRSLEALRLACGLCAGSPSSSARHSEAWQPI